MKASQILPLLYQILLIVYRGRKCHVSLKSIIHISQRIWQHFANLVVIFNIAHFSVSEDYLKKCFWWPQTRSTGVHWSVWGCVLLYTSCGAAFGISSSIAVSAVITLFNFNRLGYTTHSQTFQLCLMQMHTDTHSGLSIPLALLLPYFFLFFYLQGISALTIYEMPYMLRIISRHCKVSPLLVLSAWFISSICHPLEKVVKHLVLEGLSASFYVM